MDRLENLPVENWTVDYGDGPEPCLVPHAWNQDVSVEFDGPVVYRTEIEVPRHPAVLRFHRVSYSAEVLVDDAAVLSHKGIWDAFDLDLSVYQGRRIRIEVCVVKNGGATFPVREVASGFLPYVFNTFGGIYGDVVLMSKSEASYPSAPPSRVKVEGSRIFVDGKPFYMRGLLHWGWYPELGHPNAPEETIRAEVLAAKSLGFNLVKFCLWVPPHKYLDILKEEGMEAWLELPLWDPTDDPAKLQSMADEMERVVRQYRQHDNIICWTLGCELSGATWAEYRQYMVQMISNLSGCPMVKDNSGGAEMYGGDLREFGTFDDFHPYCDLPFYPQVLDSLRTGPRAAKPILLGEYNDADVHRDISRIGDDLPFWASNSPELNAQGVRWQFDLPRVVQGSRFSNEPRANNHRALMESSRQQALFIRKTVTEQVRSLRELSGYVITGWRDTPISSSGFFDDWGQTRFSSDECASWNCDTVLFRMPSRRPPWTSGGNRPGWRDQSNFFTGQIFIRLGVHSVNGGENGLLWSLTREDGTVVDRGGTNSVRVDRLRPTEIAQINLQVDQPGSYRLHCEFGNATNTWKINVFEPWKPLDFPQWGVELEANFGLSGTDKMIRNDLADLPGLYLLDRKGTLPMPFWREAAYEFRGDAFGLRDNWERLLPVSPDRALDLSLLPEGHEVIINRIDVRTYVEHPILVRAGDKIITTLRPQGGLGNQPWGIANNPSGAELLRRLLSELD